MNPSKNSPNTWTVTALVLFGAVLLIVLVVALASSDGPPQWGGWFRF